MDQDKIYAWIKYSLISEYVKEPILDVGCGKGYGIEYLLKMNFKEIIGIDIDPKNLRVCKKNSNTPVLSMDALNLAFKDNTFNSVVIVSVIEHLHSPHVLLKEVKRILRPGGILVIVTPNGEKNVKLKKPINPDHIKEYTINELKNLLKRASLRVVKYFGVQFLSEKKCKFEKSLRYQIIKKLSQVDLLRNIALKIPFSLKKILLGYPSYEPNMAMRKVYNRDIESADLLIIISEES